MGRHALLLAALAIGPTVAFVAFGSLGSRSCTVTRLTVSDAATYWKRSGFVEMAPPIRLPSSDGDERIVVWLKIPDKARLQVVRHEGGRASLAYPPGTVADRVDLRHGRDPASVTDVRGTRFESGEEYFHVLRPLAVSELAGVEWPRSDTRAQRAATDRMLDQLVASRGVGRDSTSDPALRLFERLNDCGGCHAHDKPERRARVLRDATDDAMPNRGTDAAGLYSIETVLVDWAPLEMHRAREMNEGDPFVTVTCGNDRAPRLATGPRGVRHYVCDEGIVPYAHLDVTAALTAHDDHARAVCGSREYLWEHMDEDGRAAFAASFEECGIQ
jgi:hypothetical protein